MPQKKDVLNHEFHCIRTLRLSCRPDNIIKKTNWYFRHKLKGYPMSQFQQFIPLILIFAIMYFLLIRPQQKKAKEHANMVSNLRRGDNVITQGGIVGKVAKVKEDGEIEVEIADGIKVRVIKSTVATVISKTDTKK